MESQVLQSRAIILLLRLAFFPRDFFEIFPLWVFFLVCRNRFGAINSIKMQFEGSVILNNAKSSHRVNADSRHPWRFVILAIACYPISAAFFGTFQPEIYAISCCCLFAGYSKYLWSARRVLS